MQNRKYSEASSLPDKNFNFTQDLLLLKSRAISLFDQMLALDINFQKDREVAMTVAERLKGNLDQLCMDHLIGQNQHEGDVRLVQRVLDCSEKGLIGGRVTLIALRSHTSYMIGTHRKGLKMIENNRQVYSRKLPGDDKSLYDIVFIPPLDSYFLASEDKLYRKDRDNEPPYLYLELTCGYRPGAYFRYSDLQGKLVINKDGTNIAVINPLTKKLEIEIEKSVGEYIRDFRLLGKKEEKVISVTNDGFVLFYSFDYFKSRGSVIAANQIDLIKERKEMPASVSVCQKNQYALAELGQAKNPYICSRMLIFKVSGDSLVNIVTIDQQIEQVGEKLSLECLGYVGRHVLWVGLSDENGFVQVYDFNPQNGDFKELEEKRESHEEKYPFKLHRLDDKFYYTGWRGQLMCLNFGK